MTSTASVCRTVVTLILLTGVIATAATAQNTEEPEYMPGLEIARAPGAIEIDGELDDPGWVGAAVASRFAEHQPGDQVPPPVDTDVLVTYDDDNFYVAYICYDDPSLVRASMAERDNVGADDNVITAIDTYGDQSFAYELGANPWGIQYDALWSTENEDVGYDAIYHSAGRITDEGYIVEFAIPFSSLRFPDTPVQTWRVDFWRNHPRQSQGQYSWAAYDRDEQCWPCQWGTITGIRDVSPGRGLEILPSMVAKQISGLDGDDRVMQDGKVDADFSLGAKVSLSSSVTAEGSFNPDFSQVESDAARIDVNSTFALQYPEKRPFFQEGSDLFNTYFNVVYTRSVNNPVFSTKVTGRPGRSSIAVLSALDDDSPQIVPFAERNGFLNAGRSFVNALRARRSFGEGSHVGVIATDRRYDAGGSGTVAGLDSGLRLGQSYSLDLQVLASRTEERDDGTGFDIGSEMEDGVYDGLFDDGRHTAAFDGETFDGYAAFARLVRDGRNWNWDLTLQDRSPTFRADVGLEPANDWRNARIYNEYMIRYEDGLVEWLRPRMNLGRKWDFSGVQKDQWVWMAVDTQLRKAQTYFRIEHMRSAELFGGVQHDGIYNWLASFDTTPSEYIGGGAYASFGHRIARRDPQLGEEVTAGASVNLKLASNVRLSLDYDYQRSDALDTGDRLFDDWTFFGRLSLQLTRELSARIVVQHSEYNEYWSVNPLVTYRLSPFSIFYVGTTRDYSLLAAAGETQPLAPRQWELAGRQYFLKLQYLFQM